MSSDRMRTVTESTEARPAAATEGTVPVVDVDLTITDAARATGTDRGTIRRLLDAGRFPGAYKDDQGFWRIPAAEFEDVDLTVEYERVTVAVDQNGASGPVTELVHQLQLECSELRARAEKAEALLGAEQRLTDELRESLKNERRTLAALLGTDVQLESHAPSNPRGNWQADLRQARAREQQLRAARAREQVR